MANFTIEIPIKFPSLNDYIKACRGNKFGANRMKQKIEKQIGGYIAALPIFESPIKIHFLWIEENKRRDYDNVAFGKKFVLDSLQKNGKLKNDNRKWVKGFSDEFGYGEAAKLIITIEEETKCKEEP